MNKFTQVFLSLMIFISLNAQNIPLPDYMPQSHPRLMICDEKKDELIFLINNEEWAYNIEKDIKKLIEIYVEKT